MPTGKQVTFCNPDRRGWLDPSAVGEVVWKEGVPYRVVGIYFTGAPESREGVCQWWIGEEAGHGEGAGEGPDGGGLSGR